MTREQGTGNREQGTGNREQGTGNREQVLRNFTFRYLCRFFPFTYLFTIPILCEAAQKNNHPYLSAVNYS
ncbi:MAG: hypothetical protein ACKPER_02615 [Dolichospermum sp.]